MPRLYSKLHCWTDSNVPSKPMRRLCRQQIFWIFFPYWIEQICPSTCPAIEAQDVAAAERLMTICTRRRYFSEEQRCLSQKRPVPAASLILSLNPFLDKKGLIRACGRVTASDSLRYDERLPIILPYECALSRLLVKFTHVISLNGGNQLVVRLTRSRYWVPRIKNLVKAVVISCKVCVIHKKRLQVQKMGSFPKERVSFSRPFTCTQGWTTPARLI